MRNRITKTFTIAVLAIGLATGLASTAYAECFADYKAKQDDPLTLHYGVIELPDTACGSLEDAAAQITPRVAADGWTLLNVVSVFDANGLDQRKESAGQYYLRY